MAKHAVVSLSESLHQCQSRGANEAGCLRASVRPGRERDKIVESARAQPAELIDGEQGETEAQIQNRTRIKAFTEARGASCRPR